MLRIKANTQSPNSSAEGRGINSLVLYALHKIAVVYLVTDHEIATVGACLCLSFAAGLPKPSRQLPGNDPRAAVATVAESRLPKPGRGPAAWMRRARRPAICVPKDKFGCFRGSEGGC